MKREKRVMSHAAKGKSKFWFYVVPALLLAFFAILAFWRIQARLRVQAGLVPVAQESNQIPVAVTHPTRSPRIRTSRSLAMCRPMSKRPSTRAPPAI